MKLFIQKKNERFNNENKCKVCGYKNINENKIINFIDRNPNKNDSNYMICEKCLNNHIKYISSNLLENFIFTSINSYNNNSMIKYNTELNNKFLVKWENIKYNDNNIDEIHFLYGFVKHNYKFKVKFKIEEPSPTPKHFKLEKQGGIGSITFDNEKEEKEFTKEFIIYDLDYLYPGTYEKYIYLKDRNNISNRKYYKINICSNIEMKKK